MTKPLVGIIMGSQSDWRTMIEAAEVLDELGVAYETKIVSAHRTPDRLWDYGKTAVERGLQVIIAGAGWAAHLAGFMAAHTSLPVIGIPIDSSPLQGMDALLSTVQMPPGIPVATVALGKGGAKNAAVLAAQILALKYASIAEKLKSYREGLTKEAIEKAKDFEK